MPCNDITEVVEARFDAGDRLMTYSLTKRTCGAAIGTATLLIDLFAGRTPEEILALDGSTLRARYRISEQDEFLYFKHLVAMQEALRALLGLDRGDPDAPCALARVGYDDGVSLTGYVTIEALTDQIRACGSCGHCGARRH